LFLIFWPLYLLRGVDLPQKERRLILILFASTVFMAPFVAVHAAYSYGLDGTIKAALFDMTAHTEVSYLTCNLKLVTIRETLTYKLGGSCDHNV
jgi:hypothetical protein